MWKLRRRDAAAVVFLGLFAGVYSFAELPQPAGSRLSPDQKIVHALDRLTFGARPGDVELVRKLGLNNWIEAQLHPETIPENPELAEKLAPLSSLTMSARELTRAYPPPQVLRAIEQGKQPYPSDPALRDRYQALIALVRERQERKAGAGELPDPAPNWEALSNLLTQNELQALRWGTPSQRVALLEALPDARLAAVLTALPQRARRGLFASAPPELRRRVLSATQPYQVVNHDLSEAKIYRAVYSNRQLEEVLTDFWYNHFNVFLDKGADRYLVPSFERDAIRPHVLGKFGDLLRATAESPAMLFYLDNWQSVDPKAWERVEKLHPQVAQRLGKRGLNENYARELMELHTLGVDGGYTQQDVIEVAKCFAGWTIRRPRQGGGFWFNPRLHDNTPKIVLGHRIDAGGMNDGLAVLDLLATHPSTAHFISRELAERFVADQPPASLVDRMARTYLKTDGDLRAVMETMIDSPEFYAPGAFRTKFKSPLEFVASALRASGAEVDFGFGLAQMVANLGQPLYRKQEPTGYYNDGAEWANTADLVARLNFALALASNRVTGVKVDLEPGQGGESADPVEAARQILNAEPGESTRKSLLSAQSGTAAAGGPPVTVAGLVLGSPDFQMH